MARDYRYSCLLSFENVARLLALGALCAAAARAQTNATRLKRLDIDELMQIEVTSVSYAPTSLAKAPSAGQVITNWDIRRAGATTLADALRVASNLNVARRNAHDWVISARGFNAELANKMLVLVDGRAVYTPLWSGVRWDVQDYVLEDIDRIEVISGPGSSTWGANAVNGVINITSRSARETQGAYVEAGAGNQLENFGSVRYGGTAAPGVYYRVYAKHISHDDEALAGGREAGDEVDIDRVGFRTDVERQAGEQFTFQGDYYLGEEGVVGSDLGKVEGGNLLARWSTLRANGSKLRVQAYYDRAFLRLPSFAGQTGSATKFYDDLQTYDLELQHHAPPNDVHAFVWGLGYRHWIDHSTAGPVIGFEPADRDQDLFSAFAQDQLSVGPGRLLTLGARLEHTDYTGFELGPTIRVQQEVGKTATFWAAVSRAVRTPSRIDRDVRQPGLPPTVLTGSPDFRSERLWAYEAGLRGGIGDALTGSISVYHNEYRNIRSVGFGPSGNFPLRLGNDVEADTNGLEVSFDADVAPRWRLHGGYSLFHVKQWVRAGGSDLNNAVNETAGPRHQLLLGSSLDLPGRVEFDLHARWVDEVPYLSGNQWQPVSSYTELDLRLGIAVSRNWSVALIGRDLLHARHVEAGAPVSSQVQLRRSVFAKVEYRY